jgi:hypothetical protein
MNNQFYSVLSYCVEKLNKILFFVNYVYDNGAEVVNTLRDYPLESYRVQSARGLSKSSSVGPGPLICP